MWILIKKMFFWKVIPPLVAHNATDHWTNIQGFLLFDKSLNAIKIFIEISMFCLLLFGYNRTYA